MDDTTQHAYYMDGLCARQAICRQRSHGDLDEFTLRGYKCAIGQIGSLNRGGVETGMLLDKGPIGMGQGKHGLIARFAHHCTSKPMS